MSIEFHDLIPLHALYALESDQVHHVEGYINSNPEARVIHAWYLKTVTILARTVPVWKPSTSLKSRVLARIRSDQASVQVRRRGINGRGGGSNVKH